MLYCPKCQRSYQEGTQRFCISDGVRLMATPDAVKIAEKSSDGVFTNLLGRSAPRYESDEKLSDKSPFFKPKTPLSIRTRLDEFDEIMPTTLQPKPVLQPQTISQPKQRQPEIENILDLSEVEALINPITQKTEQPIEQPIAKPIEMPIEMPTDKPSYLVPEKPAEKIFPQPVFRTSEGQNPQPRVIFQHEVPVSQAELGNREKHPTGRLAISLNNPDVLLGQTVKGRYYVEEKLSQDGTGISFLATDKILMGKKVVVRVLMEDADANNSQLTEERVSLSHINHPHIASLFDSGELLEGRQFLVTEFIEGKTLRAMMTKEVKVNPMRTARIIRQIGYALSDAHHNGVLHRNLKPESVMLGVTQAGVENVKVIDFCGSTYQNIKNLSVEQLAYLSPEQLDGKEFNFSSDVYSLAVICYEMLTGKHPFTYTSAKTLTDSQKHKLMLNPSGLILDLPEGVDRIIQKGLAYNAAERFPRARDFGEALFNILNAKSAAFAEKVSEESETPVSLPDKENLLDAVENGGNNDYLHISSNKNISDNELSKSVEVGKEQLSKFTNDSNLWEKRSPEPPRVLSVLWLLAGLLGLLFVIAAAVGIWAYYFRNQTQPIIQNQVQTQIEPTNSDSTNTQPVEKVADLDYPPSQRTITPPEGYTIFQNSKQGISLPTLLKNFRGFSLYYPKDWTKVQPTNTSSYFIDVKKTSPSGLPIEQIIVEPYQSKGTYKEDLAEFPRLVIQAERELKASPNYQKLDERETTINNDRKVYEIRWVSAGETKSKEMITIWGRTLFMPAQRRGIKSGLRITMLASSLSNEVKSIDDVGVKGNLEKILETFEPDPLD